MKNNRVFLTAGSFYIGEFARVNVERIRVDGNVPVATDIQYYVQWFTVSRLWPEMCVRYIAHLN